VERAREILANLEADELTPTRQPRLARRTKQRRGMRIQQLSLFAQPDEELRRELEKLDINNMTPLQALNKLNELRQKLNGKGGKGKEPRESGAAEKV